MKFNELKPPHDHQQTIGLKEKTMAENKPSKQTQHGASIKLEGKTADDFKAIKEKIETATPGIRPTNSDVIRYALHLAAHKPAA